MEPTPHVFSPPPPSAPNRVWIDDGIMYINFNQVVTMGAVQDMFVEFSSLLTAHNLSMVPVVVIYTNAGQKVKLAIKEIGKVTSLSTISMISAIAEVGLAGPSRVLTEMGNKLFFNNQLMLCNTVEEARQAVEPFKGATMGILEHERK